MSKKDYYIIEKNVSKIYEGKPTNFLDPSAYKNVITKLKGMDYQTYYPYEDSDKVIIYRDNVPDVKLLEIISYDKLTHREIMGSLFNQSIDSEMFGDIIITNNHYYILIIASIYEIIKNNFNMVGNHPIKIKEVPLSTLENYKRKYQELELIVSSIRIDNVISSIIGTSREQIKKKFLADEVILNYEICHKLNYNLIENDVFSIRRFGKYKYIGIIKDTKKGNYLIKCLKYIDN